MASNRGTITANPNFNAETTAETLEKALKTSDEQTIMKELLSCCNAQRQMIRSPFKTKFGKDLVEELKNGLSGDLKNVALALMETPVKYDATQLHKATKGLGTTESVLIDIVSSRSPSELQAIKNEYKDEFQKNLEDDIVGDTSGEFKHLLVSLLQGQRDSSNVVSIAKARSDARKLFGTKKEKPDKALFNDAFANQNVFQLARLFSEFQSIHGETIQSLIGVRLFENCAKPSSRVFSGDAKDLYSHLADFIQNKNRFFARELYEAMKGLGTRDNDLIRIVVSRSEVDLQDIRDEFEAVYKKPLADWIKSECSGTYRDTLMKIVQGN
uniref:Annexin n=1 Tax=Syphacia muris TaxID=451379 RepID=A0A0N5AB27_9BILA